MGPSIHPPTHRTIHPSIYPFICLFINPSIHPLASIHLSTYLSIPSTLSNCMTVMHSSSEPQSTKKRLSSPQKSRPGKAIPQRAEKDLYLLLINHCNSRNTYSKEQHYHRFEKSNVITGSKIATSNVRERLQLL